MVAIAYGAIQWTLMVWNWGPISETDWSEMGDPKILFLPQTFPWLSYQNDNFEDEKKKKKHSQTHLKYPKI